VLLILQPRQIDIETQPSLIGALQRFIDASLVPA